VGWLARHGGKDERGFPSLKDCKRGIVGPLWGGTDTGKIRRKRAAMREGDLIDGCTQELKGSIHARKSMQGQKSENLPLERNESGGGRRKGERTIGGKKGVKRRSEVAIGGRKTPVRGRKGGSGQITADRRKDEKSEKTRAVWREMSWNEARKRYDG